MKHSITMRAMAGTLILTMLCTGVFARPPGRMVDIGGRALHVVETEGDGPVVVLEAGGGGFSSFWLNVQPRIRDELGLRTISYDRAGLGWSEPSPQPYSIYDRANDLDALLTSLDVDTPIVLVAHSYGGWVAQAFASRYPKRVAALVLADPNSSHFFSQYRKRTAKIERDGRKRPIRGLKRIGLKMFRNWLAKRSDEPRSYFNPLLTDRHQAALGHALSAFGATSHALSEVRLPDVPTIMISRGRAEKGFPWGSPAAEAAWREGHRKLIEHLSVKEHRIAENATHAFVIEQPDTVIDAIASVIEEGI